MSTEPATVSKTVTSPMKPGMPKKIWLIIGCVGAILLACIVIMVAAYFLWYRNSYIGSGSCTSNGITYANGESFPAGDDCNTCSCSNGLAECTLMACISPSSVPYITNTPEVFPTLEPTVSPGVSVNVVPGAKIDLSKDMCFSVYTDIYCSNFDGQNIRKVVEAVETSFSNLQIFGTKIYFAADRQVYSFDTATSSLVQETEIACNNSFEFKMVVKPGEYIYDCTGEQETPTTEDFYVSNNGSVSSHLTVDGFMGGRGTSPGDVDLFSVNQAGTMAFFNTTFFAETGDYNIVPRFYIWDISQPEAARILKKTGVSFATWYDNTSVLYQDRATNTLYLYNTTTGQESKFMDLGIAINGGFVNGHKIAYSAYNTDMSSTSFYLLNLDTKQNKKVEDAAYVFGWQDSNTVMYTKFAASTAGDPDNVSMFSAFKLIGDYAYRLDNGSKTLLQIPAKDFTFISPVTKNYPDNRVFYTPIWQGD